MLLLAVKYGYMKIFTVIIGQYSAKILLIFLSILYPFLQKSVKKNTQIQSQRIKKKMKIVNLFRNGFIFWLNYRCGRHFFADSINAHVSDLCKLRDWQRWESNLLIELMLLPLLYLVIKMYQERKNSSQALVPNIW